VTSSQQPEVTSSQQPEVDNSDNKELIGNTNLTSLTKTGLQLKLRYKYNDGKNQFISTLPYIA
jgi:hypothetical protein